MIDVWNELVNRELGAMATQWLGYGDIGGLTNLLRSAYDMGCSDTRDEFEAAGIEHSDTNPQIELPFSP